MKAAEHEPLAKARQSMVLKLTNINEARPEGVVANANHSWSSAGGGWLSEQSGVWNQLPSGLYLFDAKNTVQIAELAGCNFLLSKRGDTGNAKYSSIGSVGKWLIEDVTP